MIPVVTPEEMGAIDAAAPEPVDVLIGRAGAAVAQAAIDLLGGTYGRRVVIVAGKGNNGNDGRDAAARLERRGVRVQVIPADLAPAALPPADLVIDAAYGTGFRGTYEAPDPGDAPVLAVDVPSGVDGLTGVASGRPLRAVRTVTFAALKPGLLFHDGLVLAGDVHTADIGLDVSSATVHQIEASDVAAWLPDGPFAPALERAPVVDFDRRDDLQTGWLIAMGASPTAPPRHYVPSSNDFARAVRLGLGWGLLPQFQSAAAVQRGDLVHLGGAPADVPLYWQQWNLGSPLLDAIAADIVDEGRRVLAASTA